MRWEKQYDKITHLALIEDFSKDLWIIRIKFWFHCFLVYNIIATCFLAKKNETEFAKLYNRLASCDNVFCITDRIIFIEIR